MGRLLGPLLIIALLSTGLTASAQPSPALTALEAARENFNKAIAFVEAGRWLEALGAFRESEALADRPGTVFNIANALFHLGRPLEASQVLERFLRRADVESDSELLAQGTQLLAITTQAVSTVELTLSPADASVEIDDVPQQTRGTPRVLRVEPGSHVLHIHKEGFVAVRREINVLPGTTFRESLALEAVVAAETMGTLVLTLTPPTAQLRIDDLPREGTGRERVLSLLAGTHVLRVEAEGFSALRKRIEIEAGQTAIEDIQLVPNAALAANESSIWESPWLWTGVGAVVVAGVLAAVFLTLPDEEKAEPRVRAPDGYVFQGLQSR